MYTTVPYVESKLGKQLTEQQAAYFENVVSPGVDAYIERLTGTKFGSDVTTNVYIDDEWSATIIIPTMHDITALAYVTPDGAEAEIPTDEYYTYPRGVDDKYAIKRYGGLWTHNWPWRIRLNPNKFESYGAYKISGKLGYKDIPHDIRHIATELAVKDISAVTSNVKRERVGDWDVIYADPSDIPASIMDQLEAYKRISRTI